MTEQEYRSLKRGTKVYNTETFEVKEIFTEFPEDKGEIQPAEGLQFKGDPYGLKYCHIDKWEIFDETAPLEARFNDLSDRMSVMEVIIADLVWPCN